MSPAVRGLEIAFLGLTEKDMLAINIFKSSKGIGAPKTRKRIQNFLVTLTVRQPNHMLNAQAK